jgi:formate-dependent nitrite reductase membrane component NrfD
MSESITHVGTEMQSYYGRPIVKEPVWQPEIPTYFFTGGIAGGCSLLHGFARVAGYQRLAKTALYVGAAADIVSPMLLVSDLGRPERFLHMLRVFKVTSPMSVGSWVLFVSGGASTTAAALEALGRLRPVKWAAEVVSFASGAPLATYTGTLLADTAIPVWSEARKELPWLFGASAAASAGAATALFAPAEEAGPARRLAVAGVAAELGVMEAMQHRLGFVGEVYKKEAAGKLARASKMLTASGAGLLATRGRRCRRKRARPRRRGCVALVGLPCGLPVGP